MLEVDGPKTLWEEASSQPEEGAGVTDSGEEAEAAESEEVEAVQGRKSTARSIGLRSDQS